MNRTIGVLGEAVVSTPQSGETTKLHWCRPYRLRALKREEPHAMAR